MYLGLLAESFSCLRNSATNLDSASSFTILLPHYLSIKKSLLKTVLGFSTNKVNKSFCSLANWISPLAEISKHF